MPRFSFKTKHIYTEAFQWSCVVPSIQTMSYVYVMTCDKKYLSNHSNSLCNVPTSRKPLYFQSSKTKVSRDSQNRPLKCISLNMSEDTWSLQLVIDQIHPSPWTHDSTLAKLEQSFIGQSESMEDEGCVQWNKKNFSNIIHTHVRGTTNLS